MKIRKAAQGGIFDGNHSGQFHVQYPLAKRSRSGDPSGGQADTGWHTTGTRIQRWTEARDLAVVMPRKCPKK